jgi:hypothetical protein
VTLAPLTVADELGGLKVSPLLFGVTAYAPLVRPVKL